MVNIYNFALTTYKSWLPVAILVFVMQLVSLHKFVLVAMGNIYTKGNRVIMIFS